MILVTGASGRIASSAIRDLQERDARVRVFGRRQPHLSDANRAVEWIDGGLDDARAVASAVEGVDCVILLSANSPEEIGRQEGAIDAAVAAGVRRIVKLSAIGAAADAAPDTARWHWRVEQRAAASGVEQCAVRVTRRMQSLLHQVPLLLTSGLLAGCQGTGHVADVDARDVGRVLSALAVADTLDAPVVQVTGPEAMSFGTMAVHLARALGRPVRYVDCTSADLLQCAEAAGIAPWQAHEMVAWQTEAREGRHAVVHDTVERITGRAPRRFEAFADELATSLRYANAPERPAGALEGAA